MTLDMKTEARIIAALEYAISWIENPPSDRTKMSSDAEVASRLRGALADLRRSRTASFRRG